MYIYRVSLELGVNSSRAILCVSVEIIVFSEMSLKRECITLDDECEEPRKKRSVHGHEIIPSVSLSQQPLPRVYRDAEFDSLLFHTTKTGKIRLSDDRSLAGLNESGYSGGYVFTERQLQLGGKVVRQILQTDGTYGSLGFGLTTFNPSKCGGYDLIEDPLQLLDRKEYLNVVAGDELGFKISYDGFVLRYKNNQPPVTLMHVDSTQRFYAFFDLYGSTLKVKLLGSLHDGSTRTVLRDMNGNRNATVRSRDNNECSVCCEKTINSVLYSCGHMCMCYECAYRHWKRPDGGHCPICRALIRDVIKTYWS